VRWENTFPLDELGKLEVSFDKGGTWQVIDDAIALSNGYYAWQFPEHYTKALMRMDIRGQSYSTDTFTISNPLEIQVGFNCPDSVMLKWDKIKEALSYTLFSLGDMYMEPILAAADTFVVLKKPKFPSKLYAVSPMIKGDFLGIRSPTYNYYFQGVECYFIDFLASSIGGPGVQLLLNLGTTYHVSRIDFETQGQQDFQTIYSITPVNNSSQTYLHDGPKQGINFYRARIEFDNGQSLVSKVDTVFYLTKTLALVFPNPMKQNGELNICTQYDRGNSTIFKLIDMRGRVLVVEQLISDRESINLEGISKGIYIYRLEAGNNTQTGKIVIF
jgi:hypothetical protein